MIIGIVGFRFTGKDAVADTLVKYGAQRLGFADALKRTTMEVFDFDPEQMWGSRKEEIDRRYPRELHDWKNNKCQCCNLSYDEWNKYGGQCYLTGRYALQIMGTEGARQCWSNIWVKKALDYARLIEQGHRYNQRCGIESGPDKAPTTAVFIDCRFLNEIQGVLGAGGHIYRVRRPGYEKPAYEHQSETEQLLIPDDKLHGVIYNDGTLEDLENKVLQLVRNG